MSTRRETCLAGLNTVIAANLAQDSGIVLMDRNAALAAVIDVLASGDAKCVGVLLDGDAAPPSEVLGDPVIYDHIQTAMLQIVSVHPDAATRGAVLDSIILRIDAVLQADPTLGGLCDMAQCLPPQFSDIDDEGVPEGKACELPIEILFSSTSSQG